MECIVPHVMHNWPPHYFICLAPTTNEGNSLEYPLFFQLVQVRTPHIRCILA